MIIPKAIRVGGLTYEVKMLDEVDDEGSSGETDNKKLIIKLCSKAKREAIEATFLHEMFHAINVDLAEKDVEFLAMALYGVIKNNPSLFKNGK